MKRVGEVLKSLSIQVDTEKENTSSEPSEHRCEICNDARWLRVDAEPGQPNFGRLFPCECLVREREERRATQLIELSDLSSMADLTFEAFDPTIHDVRDAFAISREFAHNPQGWLFLHGNCGVGKTHLAVAIANTVIGQKQVGVYFRVVPDLLDQLRATFDPARGVAYDDRFQQIRNAHLLVLDDLGIEQTTPWAKEKLYQLINHRYNEQLPTVVTSNQDFNKIEPRILSRLLDTRLSRYVLIEAEDYRLRDI